ncbi:hypothetical protein DTO195F2_8850 [Paecilomyces variotii]|nr:hypothetical protein DTO195F2_8850 [Paecilomyces variotii]KAJ9379017.1 hypothetical protein DTO063F5_7333 [Paecilomyces variotii]
MFHEKSAMKRLSLKTVFLLFQPLCHAIQPSAPRAIPAPLRDLQWGQLNILHTTDTHGWLAGHLHEPSYSADWGDYISFAYHMRQKAEAQDQDLLVVDTGDRVDGNGLCDASTPKCVYIPEIFAQQQIDVITIGNHELYKREVSEAEFTNITSAFGKSYLASNLDIIDPVTGEVVPFAARFRKFTTKIQGIRIMAFGFIFDFDKNANNTIVRKVGETIQEDWFQEAIRQPDIDLFLVAGHVPVNSDEIQSIISEIRKFRDTPIQHLGGHLHVRDYALYDSRAAGLASGRFMETIGFMSIDGLATRQGPATLDTPRFFRRYIDNNLFSFHHHTNLDDKSFPTELGLNTSQLIADARHTLGLDKVYGCVPMSLWMSRAPYPGENNIYTWLEQVVYDSIKYQSDGRTVFALVNTGSIRFDVLQGPFTKDTAFIVAPFTSGFRVLPGVPYSKAQQIATILNQSSKKKSSGALTWKSGQPEELIYDEDFISEEARQGFSSQKGQQILDSANYPLIPGYTTVDAGGSDGDDTIHSPIKEYQVPKCLSILVSPDNVVPDEVDLVYVDFIEAKLSFAAEEVGLAVNVSRDSTPYMASRPLSYLMVDWIQKNWACDDDA